MKKSLYHLLFGGVTLLELIFKVIVIGDIVVGKTGITTRYIHGKFDSKYKTTIGFACDLKKLVIEDKKINMIIWDISGHEMFAYIRSLYYKGAHGALIVYNVTKKESFVHLEKWFNELYKHCGTIPIILVGNKIDLIKERVIHPEEGERYARQKGIKYYEASAKTGENVIDIIEELAKLMLLEEKTFRFLTEKQPQTYVKRKSWDLAFATKSILKLFK